MSRVIGDHTWLHPLASIGDDVHMGKNCSIDEYCIVRPKCVLGDYVTMKTVATLGVGTIIGDECFIGPNVLILHLQHDGRDEPVVIEKNVWISGQSVILPGVHIVSGTIIGAMSLVHKSITKPGTYFGIPARMQSDQQYVYNKIAEE